MDCYSNCAKDRRGLSWGWRRRRRRRRRRRWQFYHEEERDDQLHLIPIRGHRSDHPSRTSSDRSDLLGYVWSSEQMPDFWGRIPRVTNWAKHFVARLSPNLTTSCIWFLFEDTGLIIRPVIDKSLNLERRVWRNYSFFLENWIFMTLIGFQKVYNRILFLFSNFKI